MSTVIGGGGGDAEEVLEAAAGRGGGASTPRQAASAEEVEAVIAGTARRGFRFAVTKAADEQAPPGLDKQIFEAAKEGKIDELLGLCREWAGHPVIDAYKEDVRSIDTNINANSNIYPAYSPTNATCSCIYYFE